MNNMNWDSTKGDLISSSELKKKLQARHDNGEEDFDKGYNIGIETAIDLIDNAKTISAMDIAVFGYDVAKKENIKGLQGEWGKWVISEIQCPNCFEYFQTDCYSTEELKKCPNCGADMRKCEQNGN